MSPSIFRGRILLLEEESGHAGTVALRLGMEGFSVETELVGGPALRRIYEERPSVVIVDLSLRGGAGTSIAQTLGWMEEVPILVISSLPDPDPDRPFAGIPSIRHVLHVPVSIPTLARLLTDCLRERAPHVHPKQRFAGRSGSR